LNEEEDLAFLRKNVGCKNLRKGILSFFIKMSHLSIKKIEENKMSIEY
jgi:hypothetical protein